MASEQAITKALLSIQNLPNSPISDGNVSQIVRQYADDLQDIPDAILEAAVITYRTGSNPFFPTSGVLRDTAIQLLLISMDVPTAHQAWSQVMQAVRGFDRVWCADGEHLYNAALAENGISTAAAHLWWKHEDQCHVCKRGVFREVYDHPIVEEIVKEMGGRDNLLSGDIGVARALFLKGYNEIVTRKIKAMTLPKVVKETIGALGVGDSVKMLAEGMKK